MRCLLLLCCLLPFSSSLALAQEIQEKPLLVVETGGHLGPILQLFFTPDGQQVLSVGEDRTVRYWDVKTGQPLKVVRPPIGPGCDGKPASAALSPDGRLLALGGWGFIAGAKRVGQVLVIDLVKEQVQVLEGPNAVVTDVSFSGNGQWLAAVGMEETAYLWRVGQVQPAHQLVAVPQRDDVQHCALSPAGQTLAISTGTLGFRLVQVATGRVMASSKDLTYELAWSPDGKLLAAAHTDGIRLWQPDGTVQLHLKQYRTCRAPQFSPEGSKLHFRAARQGIVYDLHRKKELHRITTSTDVQAVSWNTARVAGGVLYYFRGIFHIWDLKGGSPLQKCEPRLALSSPYGYPGGCSKAGTRLQVDPTLGFDLVKLDYTGPVRAADLQAPLLKLGDLSVTFSSATGVVREKGEEIARFGVAKGRMLRAVTLLDRERLVGRDSWGDLTLFNFRQQEPVQMCRAFHQQGVYGHVLPLAGGRLVAAVSHQDRRWCLWNPEQDRPLLYLCFLTVPTKKTPTGEWLAWTPEGYYACSAGAEPYFGWHLDRGRERLAGFAPAAQFRQQFQRPDVIRRLVELGSVTKALEAADRARPRE